MKRLFFWVTPVLLLIFLFPSVSFAITWYDGFSQFYNTTVVSHDGSTWIIGNPYSYTPYVHKVTSSADQTVGASLDAAKIGYDSGRFVILPDNTKWVIYDSKPQVLNDNGTLTVKDSGSASGSGGDYFLVTQYGELYMVDTFDQAHHFNKSSGTWELYATGVTGDWQHTAIGENGVIYTALA